MNVAPFLPAERVTAMRRAGLWPDLTLHECLRRACEQRPLTTAIVDHNSVTGRRTALSYLELDNLSARIAAGLWRAGVRRGDVVAA